MMTKMIEVYRPTSTMSEHHEHDGADTESQSTVDDSRRYALLKTSRAVLAATVLFGIGSCTSHDNAPTSEQTSITAMPESSNTGEQSVQPNTQIDKSALTQEIETSAYNLARTITNQYDSDDLAQASGREPVCEPTPVMRLYEDQTVLTQTLDCYQDNIKTGTTDVTNFTVTGPDDMSGLHEIDNSNISEVYVNYSTSDMMGVEEDDVKLSVSYVKENDDWSVHVSGSQNDQKEMVISTDPNAARTIDPSLRDAIVDTNTIEIMGDIAANTEYIAANGTTLLPIDESKLR